jgi:hypothetical protein
MFHTWRKIYVQFDWNNFLTACLKSNFYSVTFDLLWLLNRQWSNLVPKNQNLHSYSWVRECIVLLFLKIAFGLLDCPVVLRFNGVIFLLTRNATCWNGFHVQGVTYRILCNSLLGIWPNYCSDILLVLPQLMRVTKSLQENMAIQR